MLLNVNILQLVVVYLLHGLQIRRLGTWIRLPPSTPKSEP